MILVAIGANLPSPDGRSPLETCRLAAAALDALPGLRLRGLSRWYETAPVPPSDQPPYLNAVAHLAARATRGSAGLDPASLLAALQEIEARSGRQRGIPNAARALDLDIIAIGTMMRPAPDPVLPHPRAQDRAFVLLPLRDLAPGWVHPVLNLTVEAMIARLPPQEARPLTI